MQSLFFNFYFLKKRKKGRGKEGGRGDVNVDVLSGEVYESFQGAICNV